MNRIFKVIWNNVLQRKVVTSELGKSQSNSHSLETVKGSPILMSRPNRLWQALLLSGLLGLSTVATAEPTLFALPEGCTLDGSELTCSGKSLLFTGSDEENKDINPIMIDGKTSQVIMNKGDYQNASMEIAKEASVGKKTTLTIDLEKDSYINEIIDRSGQYNGLYNIKGSGERFDWIIVVSKSNSADGPKFNYAGGTAAKPLYTGSLNVTGATLNIESGYVQFRPKDQWISTASMVMNVQDEASIKLVDENNIPSDRVVLGTETKGNADITINLQGENSQIIFGKDAESGAIFNGQFRSEENTTQIIGSGQIRVEDRADLYLNASLDDEGGFSGTVAIAEGTLRRDFVLDVSTFDEAERIALEGEKSLLVLNYIAPGDLDDLDDFVAFDYTITGAKDANGQWQANSAGSIVFNRDADEEDLPPDTKVLLGANFLTTFRGDSLAFNGVNYSAGADEDLFDAQKGMLENTTIKLGQAMDENATLTVAQNGMKLGGLEMANGAIFDISKQEQPTSDANVQTLGTLKITGDNNTLIIGDDWIENTELEKEKYPILDGGIRQNILKIENVEGLTEAEVESLILRDSSDQLYKKFNKQDVIETANDGVVAKVNITTGHSLVLIQDSNGQVQNYLAFQSVVSEYDIQQDKTLDLTITGDQNYRSTANIIGAPDGNLVIGLKGGRTLILAGQNYAWQGTTLLKSEDGKGGTIVLENALASGDLTVADINLNINRQAQKVDSLVINNTKGVVDINGGQLTLGTLGHNQGSIKINDGTLLIQKDSTLTGITGSGALVIAGGTSTVSEAENNSELTAKIEIKKEGTLQLNKKEAGIGLGEINIAGTLNLGLAGQLVGNQLSGTGTINVQENSSVINSTNAPNDFAGQFVVFADKSLSTTQLSALGTAAISLESASATLNLQHQNEETLTNSLLGNGQVNVAGDTRLSQSSQAFAGQFKVAGDKTLTATQLAQLGDASILLAEKDSALQLLLTDQPQSEESESGIEIWHNTILGEGKVTHSEGLLQLSEESQSLSGFKGQWQIGKEGILQIDNGASLGDTAFDVTGLLVLQNSKADQEYTFNQALMGQGKVSIIGTEIGDKGESTTFTLGDKVGNKFQGELSFQQSTFYLNNAATEKLKAATVTSDDRSTIKVGDDTIDKTESQRVGNFNFGDSVLVFRVKQNENASAPGENVGLNDIYTTGTLDVNGTFNILSLADREGYDKEKQYQRIDLIADDGLTIPDLPAKENAQGLSIFELDEGAELKSIITADKIVGNVSDIHLSINDEQNVTEREIKLRNENDERTSAVGIFNFKLVKNQLESREPASRESISVNYALIQLDLKGTTEEGTAFIIGLPQDATGRAADLSALITGSGDMILDNGADNSNPHFSSFSNRRNSYSGKTVIENAALRLADDDVLGKTSLLAISDKGIVDINNKTQFIGALENKGSLLLGNGEMIEGQTIESGPRYAKLTIENRPLTDAGELQSSTLGVVSGIGTIVLEQGTLAVNDGGQENSNSQVTLDLSETSAANVTAEALHHILAGSGKVNIDNDTKNNTTLFADNSNFTGTFDIGAEKSLTADQLSALGSATILLNKNGTQLNLNHRDQGILKNTLVGAGKVNINGDTILAKGLDNKDFTGQFNIASRKSLTVTDKKAFGETQAVQIADQGYFILKTDMGDLSADISGGGILQLDKNGRLTVDALQEDKRITDTVAIDIVKRGVLTYNTSEFNHALTGKGTLNLSAGDAGQSLTFGEKVGDQFAGRIYLTESKLELKDESTQSIFKGASVIAKEDSKLIFEQDTEFNRMKLDGGTLNFKGHNIVSKSDDDSSYLEQKADGIIVADHVNFNQGIIEVDYDVKTSENLPDNSMTIQDLFVTEDYYQLAKVSDEGSVSINQENLVVKIGEEVLDPEKEDITETIKFNGKDVTLTTGYYFGITGPLFKEDYRGQKGVYLKHGTKKAIFENGFTSNGKNLNTGGAIIGSGQGNKFINNDQLTTGGGDILLLCDGDQLSSGQCGELENHSTINTGGGEIHTDGGDIINKPQEGDKKAGEIITKGGEITSGGNIQNEGKIDTSVEGELGGKIDFNGTLENKGEISTGGGNITGDDVKNHGEINLGGGELNVKALENGSSSDDPDTKPGKITIGQQEEYGTPGKVIVENGFDNQGVIDLDGGNLTLKNGGSSSSDGGLVGDKGGIIIDGGQNGSSPQFVVSGHNDGLKEGVIVEIAGNSDDSHKASVVIEGGGSLGTAVINNEGELILKGDNINCDATGEGKIGCDYPDEDRSIKNAIKGNGSIKIEAMTPDDPNNPRGKVELSGNNVDFRGNISVDKQGTLVIREDLERLGSGEAVVDLTEKGSKLVIADVKQVEEGPIVSTELDQNIKGQGEVRFDGSEVSIVGKNNSDFSGQWHLTGTCLEASCDSNEIGSRVEIDRDENLGKGSVLIDEESTLVLHQYNQDQNGDLPEGNSVKNVITGEGTIELDESEITYNEGSMQDFAGGFQINEDSILHLVDQSEFGNKLTGDGLLTVNNSGSGNGSDNRFSFNTETVGEEFAGTLDLANGNWYLDQAQANVMQNGTVKVSDNGVITIGSGNDGNGNESKNPSLKSIDLAGGTLRFNDIYQEWAQIKSRNILELEALDLANTRGVIEVDGFVDTLDPLIRLHNSVEANPEGISLIELNHGPGFLQLVTVDDLEGELTDSLTLQLKDKEGNLLENSESTLMLTNKGVADKGREEIVAEGTFDYGLTTTGDALLRQAQNGLYVSYGLTKLNILNGKTVVLEGATGKNNSFNAQITENSEYGSLEIRNETETDETETDIVVTLGNSGNSYSGSTTVASGGLKVAVDGALGTSNLIIKENANFNLNGTTQKGSGLSIERGGIFYNGSGIATGIFGSEDAELSNAGQLYIGALEDEDQQQQLTLRGNLTNSGEIYIASDRTEGSKATGSVLTIEGAYVGANGHLYMNAHINGAGQSSSDQLLINGEASGHTTVHINTSGMGGDLGAKDLMLIETEKSTDDAFKAGNIIVIGSYEYFLRKEEDQNWYLSNERNQPGNGGDKPGDGGDKPGDGGDQPGDGGDKPGDGGDQPGDGGDKPGNGENKPGGGDKDNYRPDIGTTLANTDGALNNQIPGLGSIGGFGSPISGGLGLRHDIGKDISIWNVTRGGKLYGRALNEKLRFTNEYYSTTFGADKLFKLDSGATLRLGAMISIMRSSTHSKNYSTTSTSKGRVTGPAFGLYGTWYADGNDRYSPYVDVILSYGRYHNRVELPGNPVATYRSHLWSFTVQGGYPFDIGNEVLLEPQGQVTYLNYRANEYVDHTGNVRVKNGTKGSFVGRTGLFIYSEEENITPYIGINLWYDGVKSTTQFNTDLYEGDRKSFSMELKAGVTGMEVDSSTLSIDTFYRKGRQGLKDYGAGISWKYSL